MRMPDQTAQNEFIESLDPRYDRDLVARACLYAKKAHEGSFRLNGEPYFNHPLAVAQHMINIQMDTVTVVAALLHDAIEEDKRSKNDLMLEFGGEVAELVDGVSVVKSYVTKTGEKDYYENIRKLLLASAKDVRVLLIRLAEKLHNLETIQNLTDAQKRFELDKVFEIYAPLADRLGVAYFKTRLTNLAFQYLYPQEYKIIDRFLEQQALISRAKVTSFIDEIKESLQKSEITAEIKYRTKSHYSIYKKYVARREEHESLVEFLPKLHDIYGVMIIVGSIEDCYRTLGKVHRGWLYDEKRFDDYVSKPKPNGYRSIQTVIYLDYELQVEVQIKTNEMHEFNEYGPAAHIKYKESDYHKRSNLPVKQQEISWLKSISEWHETMISESEFEKAFKIDLFGDRALVYTPKYDVIDLPKGSTPIDFAYEVHTDIGNRLTGAKVNGRLVPLTYVLSTGEVCEILTTKIPKKPNRDWLDIVYRPFTKKCIRREL